MDVGDKTDMHDLVWPNLGNHALGALPPRLAARADRHIAECERCRARVEGYRSAVDVLAVMGDDASSDVARLWEQARFLVRRRQAEIAS
jgi:anti-sigma factor RsiW